MYWNVPLWTMQTVRKSICAGIFIALGCWINLVIGGILGAFLFAFGLLGVCVLKLNLFTGKCGYIFENKQWRQLIITLIVNLLTGFICGLLISVASPELISIASAKVISWEISISYFIKAICCGMIMFTAVDIYKKGSYLGIILGIPLFILCGFQHCIANIIIMGVARTWSNALLITIAGNWLGSLLVYWLKGKES